MVLSRGGVHLSQVHQHNKIYILPQNSEHILAGIFSHRFHSKFAEECDAVA
jgi:hypothetical protein